MNNQYELIGLIVSEGTLEILKYLEKADVGHFRDLRDLKNLRTKKNFSSNTISARLKELVKYGAIERTIYEVSGRGVAAYKITVAGKKCIEIADKFEGELRRELK